MHAFSTNSKPVLSSKEKQKIPYQTPTTPLVLRTSEGQNTGSTTDPPISSHALVVAQVFGALHPSPLLENLDLSMSESGDEESDEDDSDCATSEYDDPKELDDSITLDLFQNGLRKEGLVL